MNTILLNTVSLDGGTIIKKGSGGGGVTIKNQEKILEITENGVTEVAPDSGFTGLSKVVVNTNVALSGGGVESKPVSDVTFYDYDGVVLYSYTKDEFLAMSEMPPLPTRKGLICQEWNWDYEDAIAYVSEYGKLYIGAIYITDDGKTRLYIQILAENTRNVPLYFYQSVANGVTIDWGDGSAPQTLGGTSDVNTTHTYAEIGEYVISLDVAEDCKLYFYSYYPVGANNNAYNKMLYKMEIGSQVKTIYYTSKNLVSITIPNGVNLKSNALSFTPALRHVTVPRNSTLERQVLRQCGAYSISFPNDTVTDDMTFEDSDRLSIISIPNNCTKLPSFRNTGLKSFNIPNGVTEISNSAFNECSFLASVVFPETITAIGNSAFYHCESLMKCDFSRSTVVPTLSGVTTFSGVHSDCKIIVPDALYDEWIAATNWSSYASKIIKKSDWDASQS